MMLAADDSLAEMRARSRFGIAIAAMIKMIATTISNSISEKPELGRACALEPIVPTLERNQTASMLNREETSLDRSRLSRLSHRSPYCAATNGYHSSLPARYVYNFAELARTLTFERSSSL